MSVLDMLDEVLESLLKDSVTKNYIVREGFEAPVSDSMVSIGLVEVGIDPGFVCEDDDYQSTGCVRVRNRVLFRISRRERDLNAARRKVIDMADDVKNAIQVSTEDVGVSSIRHQSPIFTAMTLSALEGPELDAEFNVVSGSFGLEALEYQTPGAR